MNLWVGGIDFVIVEDWKFKSGFEGKIFKMGFWLDYINDLDYDCVVVDVEGLVLLGDW